jgi:hypothetical protein
MFTVRRHGRDGREVRAKSLQAGGRHRIDDRVRGRRQVGWRGRAGWMRVGWGHAVKLNHARLVRWLGPNGS